MGALVGATVDYCEYNTIFGGFHEERDRGLIVSASCRSKCSGPPTEGFALLFRETTMAERFRDIGGKICALVHDSVANRVISTFSPPHIISFQAVICVAAIGIPVAKNLSIMGLWIVPTTCVSVSKRLALLDILHEIGRADVLGTVSRF